MARDRECFERFRPGLHQRVTSATGLLAVALLLGLQAGCGGGSSGTQNSPPPAPTFTTVDAPGAGTTEPEGTFGSGVNNGGEVAGFYVDANGVVHGFIRGSGGSITTVDAPGAGTTQGLGTSVAEINATGEVAGFFFDSQDIEHSFFRGSDGTIAVFDPAGSSGAVSINDGGTVAGGFVDINGAHGYLRAPDGTFTTFDPTGNATQVRIVIPYQINAGGAVAGTYVDSSSVFHGFLRNSSGTITTLDAPGAGTAANTGTEIADMNTSGVMVGGINVGQVGGIIVTHSLILATDGTYTVFDPPQSGAHSSFAEAINDSGVVVGTYRDANLVRHGYIRHPDGTFVSFDDPDAAQLPLSTINVGTNPRRINLSGVVIGFYSDAAGVRHTFILQ